MKLDKEKKVIVFFHGFASNKSVINGLNRIDNRDYRIKSVDFPGSGNAIASEPVSLEIFYDFAKNFLDSIPEKEILLLGHSLGAAIAMSQSNHHKVKGIILMSPLTWFLAKEQDLKNLRSWLIPKTLSDATKSYVSLVANKEKQSYFKNVERSSNIFFKYMQSKKHIFNNMMMEQITNDYYLTNILKPMYLANNKPLRTISGDKDLFSYTNLQLKMCEELNVKKYLLKNCGHSPAFEYPEKINLILNEIIKEFNF